MEYRDIQRYLHEVLGANTPIRPWPGAKGLPFFLQDAYNFAELRLLGTHCVLAIADRPQKGEANIRRHLDTLLKHAPNDILPIYVTPALASYERKRLITQHVPFIVPGNQLFLPSLGVDLREYFRDRRDVASNAIRPATQALLFTALLRPWKQEIHPNALNEQLNYTSMTVSRAVRELQASGLAKTYAHGRERWLRFDQSPRDVWQQAKPWLRSPVRKSYWAISDMPPMKAGPLAGLSALAMQSALADPEYPVRAISSERWKQAQRADLRKVHVPEPGVIQWQIWSYDPASVTDSDVVDPLSLITSFRDEADERVRQAVDHLEKQLPW